MTKKIGILTLHRSLNYGAVWQCWALKRACESMGYDAETIDYNPFGDYEAKWFIGKRPSTTYRYWMQMYQFNRFVAKRLNPTPHTVSHDWIKANPPQDDVYIVGSDQVWTNAVTGAYLDSYMLNFVPSGVRRISYAASTGGNPLELNENQLKELRKFSSISVREQQSVTDVQSKVEVPVADVCDPTILLTVEEYGTIEKKPLWLPKHYMVYFDLAGDSLCTECAKQLSEKLGLPILNLAGRFQRWAWYNYIAPTPEQWLYILHHADYVCTNSFHGVAMSIVYRRPFVFCAPQKGGRAKNNHRIQNLLEQTGLKERYITDIEQTGSMLSNEIEFDESAIDIYRNRSMMWLKNAIENETNKK